MPRSYCIKHSRTSLYLAENPAFRDPRRHSRYRWVRTRNEALVFEKFDHARTATSMIGPGAEEHAKIVDSIGDEEVTDRSGRASDRLDHSDVRANSQFHTVDQFIAAAGDILLERVRRSLGPN